MNRINFVMCLSLFAFGAQPLFADDGSVFKTSGASQYENGEITVQSHGDSLVMRAKLVDRGHVHDVEATLDPVGNDHFRGSGKITVRYDDGTGCRHRFGVVMTIRADEIYLRENTPQTIPWNPNGPCQAAGPYEWFNHPEPYVRH